MLFCCLSVVLNINIRTSSKGSAFDEFVDAVDEVDDDADHAAWVTKQHDSGAGEVQLSISA